MKSENILIFGAGSIGSYLAAKIYNSGYHVDVIGRKAEKIGNFLYINNKRYDFPPVSYEIDAGKKYDYVFLTSKMFDLKKNLNHLSKTDFNIGIPVLVQNCFFDIEEYKKILGQDIVSILVYDGFNLTGNQLNHIKGAGFFIEDNQLSEDVYLLLKNAGADINKTDYIVRQRAEKTIYNCSINIFSAIYSKFFRELFEDKVMIQRMQDVFYESYEILSRMVTNLQDKKVLWNNFCKVVRSMEHYSSTYQDVRMNKMTELASLNGFIIESGKKMNINTQYNIEIMKEFRTEYPDLY